MVMGHDLVRHLPAYAGGNIDEDKREKSHDEANGTGGTGGDGDQRNPEDQRTNGNGKALLRTKRRPARLGSPGHLLAHLLGQPLGELIDKVLVVFRAKLVSSGERRLKFTLEVLIVGGLQ
jgi:hypothetical protein